ncbi:MAG: Fe-S cluster biosynthesis and repair protein YggX [Gammaproteobacteria bacterium]|jgi:Fe-S cluster biosynthesis and repair protein YggX
MTRVVGCVVLKREAQGMNEPPYPGELGARIYENVSGEGWKQWLNRLQMIINENGLNTGDPQSIELIERHMIGFLFDEGGDGGLPPGFQAPGAKAPPSAKK